MEKKIINDPWVLKTIQRYEILFDERPYQFKNPSQISFNDQETMVVNDEINDVLGKGAIREIDESDDLFISNISVVPIKKNGKLCRPIINLKSLDVPIICMIL